MENEIHAFTITDPLSGKLDWNLPEGVERDRGQLVTWGDEQLRTFLEKNDYKYLKVNIKSPVSLLYLRDKPMIVDAKSEQFDTFDELINRVQKDDCLVLYIIQNVITGKFMLRLYDIPENFDVDFHINISKIYDVVRSVIASMGRKLEKDDVFHSISVTMYDAIQALPEKSKNEYTIESFINQMNKTR